MSNEIRCVKCNGPTAFDKMFCEDHCYETPCTNKEPEVVGYRCRQSETENWTMSTTPAYWEHKPVILLEDYKAKVEELQDELESMNHWRNLALQFDNHRMAALWHLKRLVVYPESKSCAELFLSEPPMSAHQVVAERDALKSDLSEARNLIDYVLGSFEGAPNHPWIPGGVANEVKQRIEDYKASVDEVEQKSIDRLNTFDPSTSISHSQMRERYDDIDTPEYHHQGMGCGLEDRGITDRYDAVQYGWDEAANRYQSEVVNPLLDTIANLRAELIKVKANSKHLAELDDRTIKQLGDKLRTICEKYKRGTLTIVDIDSIIKNLKVV